MGARAVKNAERMHLNKVAELGCIACRINGHPDSRAEIHHLRDGYGKGQRSSNYEVIPLCPAHHRGTLGLSVPSIHLSKFDFIDAFGTERDLLAEVLELI